MTPSTFPATQDTDFPDMLTGAGGAGGGGGGGGAGLVVVVVCGGGEVAGRVW